MTSSHSTVIGAKADNNTANTALQETVEVHITLLNSQAKYMSFTSSVVVVMVQKHQS